MRKNLFYTLLLTLALLTACAGEAEEGSSGASASGTGATTSASDASAPGGEDTPQPADYAGLVFDTGQEQGRLTAR